MNDGVQNHVTPHFKMKTCRKILPLQFRIGIQRNSIFVLIQLVQQRKKNALKRFSFIFLPGCAVEVVKIFDFRKRLGVCNSDYFIPGKNNPF